MDGALAGKVNGCHRRSRRFSLSVRRETKVSGARGSRCARIRVPPFTRAAYITSRAGGKKGNYVPFYPREIIGLACVLARVILIAIRFDCGKVTTVTCSLDISQAHRVCVSGITFSRHGPSLPVSLSVIA